MKPLLRVVLAAEAERRLFRSEAANGFAKLEGGVASADGLVVPSAGANTSWRAFSTVVGPRTRLRLRMKAEGGVREPWIIAWSEARKQNARTSLRRLLKGEWTDVDLAVADFRFGFAPSDPSFEGEIFDGFRIYFEGPADGRLLLERVEVVETGP